MQREPGSEIVGGNFEGEISATENRIKQLEDDLNGIVKELENDLEEWLGEVNTDLSSYLSD